MQSEITDRRRSARHTTDLFVRLSRGPDQNVSIGEIIDIAAHGLLARLPAVGEPPGQGDRVLLSFDLVDGALHVLGRTSRSVRGADGHWYVAVEFGDVEPLDRSRLDRLLSGPSRG